MDERTRTWSGSMPEVYDRLLVPALFAPAADDLVTRALPMAPTRVLEIAAGTGVLTGKLCAALPDAAVTATDLNDAMAAYAEARVPEATWRPADAMALPFADDAFDLVVCQCGVMFLPDRIAGYREALRVLRAGGTFLFNAWDEVSANHGPDAVAAALHDMGETKAHAFFVGIPHGYCDVTRVRADVEAAGFTDVAIERVVYRGATTAAALARGFAEGSPVRAFLEASGDLAARRDDLIDRVTARLGDGPVETRPAAFVVSARKPA
ncbi:MAG TPA: methyltransferase domain-containing protein [Mycobacteriales bacterium]|nr:methyltransferase domain-containing protein [Mycobacteriales bacterium]